MTLSSVVFFTVLIAGSFALPSPALEPDNALFYHTDPNARIVGGTPVPVGSVPYMVALTQGALVPSLFCGGSLITTRTVMTAAHCIAAVARDGVLLNTVLARVGTNLWASGGLAYLIERNVTHQEYTSSTIKNDIGILITASEVALTSDIQPVPLSFEWVGGGVMTRVAGWGRIYAGGPISATLLELSPQTIDGDNCVAILSSLTNNPVDPETEICTFHSEGHGMCNGDSGSALVRQDTGQQIGIVSWGMACARGAPDMFVRVSAYADWITQYVV